MIDPFEVDRFNVIEVAMMGNLEISVNV